MCVRACVRACVRVEGGVNEIYLNLIDWGNGGAFSKKILWCLTYPYNKGKSKATVS